MTREQIITLDQVKNRLDECRQLLDGVMYHSTPITDLEYSRCRAIYDRICEATDNM